MFHFCIVSNRVAVLSERQQKYSKSKKMFCAKFYTLCYSEWWGIYEQGDQGPIFRTFFSHGKSLSAEFLGETIF
jgi:hypothetical protein